MSELPVPRPPRRTHETAPFWDACAEGRLVLPRCQRCGELIWYPRRFCPFCAGTEVSWIEVSGHGTVYSFTVMRRGAGAYADAAPYVVAYVQLDEGPRVLTNVVGADPDQLEVGTPVRVVFDDAGDGEALFRFTPR